MSVDEPVQYGGMSYTQYYPVGSQNGSRAAFP